MKLIKILLWVLGVIYFLFCVFMFFYVLIGTLAGNVQVNAVSFIPLFVPLMIGGLVYESKSKNNK